MIIAKYLTNTHLNENKILKSNDATISIDRSAYRWPSFSFSDVKLVFYCDVFYRFLRMTMTMTKIFSYRTTFFLQDFLFTSIQEIRESKKP